MSYVLCHVDLTKYARATGLHSPDVTVRLR
jgi:hypothetical protein